MQPQFNINRPPVSDEEIEKHKNFDALVAQFKKQSLKKARGDESWWKNKKVQYTTVILGVTVVCTVTYQSIRTKNQISNLKPANEKIVTQKSTTASSKKPAPYVAPRITAINKKARSYKVNNQKGAELVHPSSTRIVVPRGAFVDNKGAEIIGEVTLEYREFDHLPDIIAAGIPMRHDSLGKGYQLESAGMFEIRANQDGTPVRIRNGSPVTVDLASYNKENRFYQYFLDTVARNWRYLGHDKPMPATAQASTAAGISAGGPSLEATIAKKSDSLERIYRAITAAGNAPRKPAQPVKHRTGRPTFVLEGSYQDFPELATFENIVFEVGPENRNYTPELHDITWSDIRITQGPVRGSNYILHLAYRSRKESLVVYPVLREGDYEKARSIYDQKLEAYNSAIKEKQERESQAAAEFKQKQEEIARQLRNSEQERLSRLRNAAEARAQQANQMSASVVARRLFQVASFGIYNSDHPHSADITPLLQPSFVDADSRTAIRPEAVYVIDHRRKTVITCDPSNCYLPGGNDYDYSLCLVYDGDVYTCDKTLYKKTIDAGKRSFELVRREGAANNMSDFRKALEI